MRSSSHHACIQVRPRFLEGHPTPEPAQLPSIPGLGSVYTIFVYVDCALVALGCSGISRARLTTARGCRAERCLCATEPHLRGSYVSYVLSSDMLTFRRALQALPLCTTPDTKRLLEPDPRASSARVHQRAHAGLDAYRLTRRVPRVSTCSAGVTDTRSTAAPAPPVGARRVAGQVDRKQ